MRKVFSPLPVLFMLLLACVAAHAQPARPQQRPERDARCRRAAMRYVHPSPDKKHLTVEQEEDYEYRGMKKYLAVCGDSDDEFTLRIKHAVVSYEAARLASSQPAAPPPPKSCDQRRAELGKTLRGRFRGDERAKQNYEAAREFLRDCGDKKEAFDRYLSNWVEKYEKAAREFEEKRQNGEPPAKGPAKEQ